MSQVLQLRCPLCGRLSPINTWAKIAASTQDYLGRFQEFKGYRAIESGPELYRPEDIDWAKLNGFGVEIQREPKPSELVKSRLVHAFSWWLKEGWLTDSELAALGLRRMLVLPGIRRSVAVIAGERVVATKARKFEI